MAECKPAPACTSGAPSTFAANVVWLTASPEALWDRVQADPKTIDSRPALTERTGLDELRQLLADRKRCYEDTADLTIETEGKTPHEVAEAIAHILPGSARP